MKKFILAALVAVVSVSANAQFWAGGEVGFNTSKTTFDGNDVSKSNAFAIVPEVGYSLNDNWDVAVAVGFTHNYREAGSSSNVNTFVLNPYVRYTFAKAGNFSFFADGGFNYNYSHTSGVDDNTIGWGINIKPGIAYALSDKVSLVAHVGKVGWDFEKTGDLKTNDFTLGVSGNSILFGAYVNF